MKHFPALLCACLSLLPATGLADGKHGVVFTGGTPDTFTVYFDNLRVRHADGRTTPLWTSGKDTRAGAFAANDLFNDLKIRTVNVADVSR